MSSCILMERKSSLYKGLLSFIGDREVTNSIWALSQIPEVMDNLKGIEYGEDGEPTVESFIKAVNLKEALEGKITLLGKKIEAGATDSKGNPVYHDSATEAINKADKINKENDDIVADVHTTEKGSVIDINYKTIDNEDVPQTLKFHSTLNNKLLGIMHSLGFTASVDDAMTHGIFDPTNAVSTYEGLMSVIRIAKGEQGEESFPEEFAHFIIEGLTNHNLVSRLMNSLDGDSVRTILGNRYENYKEKYGNDLWMLKREAAGKLLAEHIKGVHTPYVKPEGLLSRIWNYVKSLFSSVQDDDIYRALDEANRAAENLASLVMSEDLTNLVDKNAIISAKTLFDLGDSISAEQKLADKALETMARRMNLIRARSNRGYSKEDRKTFEKIKKAYDEKKYVKSCYGFLLDSLIQIEELNDKINAIKERDTRDDTNINKIRKIAVALNGIKEFAEGYIPILEELRNAKAAQRRGELEMSEEDAEKLHDKALEALDILDDLSKQYRTLRYNVVYSFLKTYWGDDKIIDVGKHKGTKITLEGILEMADKDINGIDRWISTLSSVSDPMLNVMSKAAKTAAAARDAELNDKVLPAIRQVHKKFVDAGGDTSFMYERDSTGKLTGYIISDIDFGKFKRDRDAFIDKLKEKGITGTDAMIAIEKWERKNTETVVLDSESGRSEHLPKEAIYGTNRLDSLTDAQREYYNNMMALKRQMDSLLPSRYVNTYIAPQVRNDNIENIASNIANPKKAAKIALDTIKDKFVRREDDTEFGDTSERSILMDFNGNPVKSIPIYYTKLIEDTDRLSTDFTSSITAYSSMAVNYNNMNKIIDVMELARDIVHERKVQQLSGDTKLNESFTVLHNTFSKAYTKKGSESNIGGRIDDFFDNFFYGKTKLDEGTILGMDQAKSLDTMKSFTGVLGLGVNLFSGMGNVTVGKMQIFIESMSGEYFNYKNSQIGKKNYYALLSDYLGELNSTTKTSKLGLLIDRFDALEEFYNGLRNSGYYQSPLARIIGNANVFILNNAGEHYLHSRTMLAILDRYKVKDGSKEISLFDAFEVEKATDPSGNVLAAKLKIKDGVTKLDGTAITEADITELKLKIGRVNQSLNGAFNEADKGAIHKYALGRLAMQFRQWMPEHYQRRFAGTYYDAALDKWREGYYRTVGRFVLDTIKDLRRAKFEIGTRWDSLSEHEKANFKRAGTELALYATLAISCSMIGPAKNHKGVWWKRALLYNLKRMQLETGASMPVPAFFDNVFTILKSPAASINTLDHTIGLLEFQNLFVEKQSGRYKGWSEYRKNAYLLTPLLGQLNKIRDITDEDYMFTIFKNY